ncbi:hypothetical protein NECAME_02258 [Necator americanus]|uniref:C2H2-type domain-containing protein n=1 Tax=Necator americanus TaxID=51031 RepID=W2TGZ4_NECAM|nr:hypothetical protein NECAME_02258 [Necator americanus]ETN80859.1 hypothetical protein NECAME_02258 [Necator americanus]
MEVATPFTKRTLSLRTTYRSVEKSAICGKKHGEPLLILKSGLGLEVIYTNDAPSSSLSTTTEEPNESSCTVNYFDEAHMGLQQLFDPILLEYAALLSFIEANVNVELNKSAIETAAPKVTVQCKVGRPIVLNMDTSERETVTCMLCQEEVPRDRTSLKAHVQSHSGKRYGCSRCKYHTDRKFDFTRHIRRRHEGEPDPSDGGNRPHWMTMVRSCFPSYGDFAKLRTIRQQKTSASSCAQMRTHINSAEQQDLREKDSSVNCSPVVC